MATSANIRPPLKHTPFDTTTADGTILVSNEWYDWALNMRKAIDTLRIIVGDPDGDGVVDDVNNLLTADVAVFARDMFPSVTAGCSSLTTIEFASTQPNFHALLFDPTTDESADFHCMLPFSWAGKTFKVYVYWGHGAGGTAFGVTWEITANSTSDNESVILNFSPGAVVIDTGGTSGNLYIAALSTEIPIARNLARDGDMVSVRIYRRPTHASDTLDIDAALLAVRFVLSEAPFPTTPDASPVALLLHFESNFTDSSTNAHVPTALGSAVTSATAVKWGTKGFLGDGSMYVTYPDSTLFNFGSRIWSVDFWIYIPTATSLATDNTIICSWGTGASTSNAISWYIGLNATGSLRFLYSTNGTTLTGAVNASSTALTRDTWIHVAYWISASNPGLQTALNGTSRYSVLSGAFTLYDSTVALGLFATAAGGARMPSGVRVDELRICVDGQVPYDNADFPLPSGAYA